MRAYSAHVKMPPFWLQCWCAGGWEEESVEGSECMGQIYGLSLVLGLQLDSMVLKIFSNLNNSVLCSYSNKRQQCQNMLITQLCSVAKVTGVL